MITQQSLLFLDDLRAHNDRDWFQGNKDRYEAALEEFRDLVQAWHAGLGPHYPDVADNDPRKAIFRIYRDVRFSQDKRPYKDHFGASLCRGGRTSSWAGFYLHLSPGASFLAGGKWMPDNTELKKIRQEIDYNHEQLRVIVEAPAFRERFGDLSTEHSLKTIPRDYSADHPAIDWLKLKSFVVSMDLTDEQVISPGFLEALIQSSLLMRPFLDYLNVALEEV
jgi:uncharacterized protein (TIGR02453 family)